MNANITWGFSVAVFALMIAVRGVRISAAPNPQVKSGVDRLYVIDCGDGSGTDESRGGVSRMGTRHRPDLAQTNYARGSAPRNTR